MAFFAASRQIPDPRTEDSDGVDTVDPDSRIPDAAEVVPPFDGGIRGRLARLASVVRASHSAGVPF